MKNDTKSSLKVLFTTSVAAFEMTERIQKIYGNDVSEKHKLMKELHQKALQALESDDWQQEITTLSTQMEAIAASTSPAFPKSGVEIKGASRSPFVSDEESFIKETPPSE